MTNDVRCTRARRAARALALTPAVLVLAAAGPALASPPRQWGPAPEVSPMHALTIYLFIPLGLIVLITFLALVPSLVKGDRYTPGQAWRHQPEWFGGPRDDAGDTDQSTDRQAVEQGPDDRGGASARW